MAKMKQQKYFIVIASLQVIFACIALINEFLAVSRQFPMTSFPAEHQQSWEKILVFCGSAIISVLAAWFFNSRQHLTPSLISVFLLATFLTLSGVFISHYLSVLGWCCESAFTYYFGFPFSFVLGIGGFDYSIQQYGNFNFAEVLAHPELVTSWNFLPYHFYLSLLFWSNTGFLILSLASLPVSKIRIPRRQIKGHVQSESTRVF